MVTITTALRLAAGLMFSERTAQFLADSFVLSVNRTASLLTGSNSGKRTSLVKRDRINIWLPRDLPPFSDFVFSCLFDCLKALSGIAAFGRKESAINTETALVFAVNGRAPPKSPASTRSVAVFGLLRNRFLSSWLRFFAAAGATLFT